MMSWLFDPRPMMEWRADELESLKPEWLKENHLGSARAPEGRRGSLPRDPLLHYRDYVDPTGRRSTVAYVRYADQPGRSAQLVEMCWTKGIAVAVWFESPPSEEAPFWRQIMSFRSIEIADSGRLRWQPVISWRFAAAEDRGESLIEWFKCDAPLFPPPLFRLVFGENATPDAVRGTLENLLRSSLPCRFKLLSLPHSHYRFFKEEDWRALLVRFDERGARSREESEVIQLFPAGG